MNKLESHGEKNYTCLCKPYWASHFLLILYNIFYFFYDPSVSIERHPFLFLGFLIMKTTFSYFPGMFEIHCQPWQQVVNEIQFKKNKMKDIIKYKLYTVGFNVWLSILKFN